MIMVQSKDEGVGKKMNEDENKIINVKEGWREEREDGQSKMSNLRSEAQQQKHTLLGVPFLNEHTLLIFSIRPFTLH